MFRDHHASCRGRVPGAARLPGLLLATLVLGLGASVCHSQTVLEVPADFPSIQSAIESAADGDTVLVAPGFYSGPIDFLGKAITVTSSDGPDVTTLDPEMGVPAVTFASDEGSDSVLSGFRITNVMSSALAGGGVFCDGTSPTLENNVIAGTSAIDGGGLYVASNTEPVSVSDCVFTGFATSTGGGVSLSSAMAVFQSCVVESSSSSLFGGGVYSEDSSATFTDCVIQGSSTGFDGGGMLLINSVVTLERCLFLANDATFGGAIDCDSGTVLESRFCLFADNTAASGAGAIALTVNESTLDFSNCTFSGNDAPDGSVIRFSPGTPSDVTMTSCILWGNPGDPISGPGNGTLTITYSDVEGSYPGIGNIDEDPLFVDPDAGEFTLQAGSPCIDAGDPASPPDPDGTVTDMGAFFFPQDEIFKRGDADGDGDFSALLDGIFVLSFQFIPGSPQPDCFDAADADDDGQLNGLIDGVLILSFGFIPGSPPPLAPGPDRCGVDPTADSLPPCAFAGPC